MGKRETTEDMRLTVLEYIRMQVEYNKRMEQIWANLIPQLEKVQLDPNANVVGDAADKADLGVEGSNAMASRGLPIGASTYQQQSMKEGSLSSGPPGNNNISISNPQQAQMQSINPVPQGSTILNSFGR